jgi:hypothetical protein
MRKWIVALLIMVALSVPMFALGWEVGLSGTPVPADNGDIEALVGFHFGFSPWAILYASWDALVAPPSLVENLTGSYDVESEITKGGQYRPGFLNLFDVGIRLVLGPIVAFTEIGTNAIHVYDPDAAIRDRGVCEYAGSRGHTEGPGGREHPQMGAWTDQPDTVPDGRDLLLGEVQK